MHVYFILNHINWKYYLGKTKERNLARYWSNQKYRIFNPKNSCTSKPHLYNAVRRYGWENFTVHSLRSNFATEEECLAWEQVMIKALRSRDSSVGYNVCAGGRGAIGWKPTSEQRAKISKAKKGKPGISPSPEVREKIRASLIAKGQRPPEVAAKISATMQLRGQTEKQKETWRNMIANHHNSGLPAGFRHSDESKAKMRVSMRGRKAHNLKDMAGQIINGIEVLERSGSSKSGKAMWSCRCRCGNTFVTSGDNLRNEHTRSCGCLSSIAWRGVNDNGTGKQSLGGRNQG